MQRVTRGLTARRGPGRRQRCAARPPARDAPSTSPCSKATTVMGSGAATPRAIEARRGRAGNQEAWAVRRLVAYRECLVQHNAVAGERTHADAGRAAEMQVVDHHDGVEDAAPANGHAPASRSSPLDVDPLHTLAASTDFGIAVDRQYPRAPRAANKRACRPCPAARSSTRAPRATSGDEAHDPRRGREWVEPLVRFHAGMPSFASRLATAAGSPPPLRPRSHAMKATAHWAVFASGAGRGNGVVAARGVVALGKWRNEVAALEESGDERNAAERHALSRDRRLDHLVVEREYLDRRPTA